MAERMVDNSTSASSNSAVPVIGLLGKGYDTGNSRDKRVFGVFGAD